MKARIIAPGLSAKRSAAGRIGGVQTFLRSGREEMSRRGRKGGRPRLPTLEELESQASAPQHPMSKGETYQHLTAGKRSRTRAAGGALKIKEGEPAGCGSGGSPEGAGAWNTQP